MRTGAGMYRPGRRRLPTPTRTRRTRRRWPAWCSISICTFCRRTSASLVCGRLGLIGERPMTHWEYCEAVWQPDQVSLTMPVPDEEPVPTSYPAQQWPQVMAQLGADGWEMASCTASPVGAHEYYF